MSLRFPTHRTYAFSSGQSSSSESNFGYVGFLGSLLILIAFNSIIFAGLDPTTNIRYWLVLTVEFIGGLAIGMFYGFKSPTGRANIDREIQGALLGVLLGVLVLGFEMAVLTAQFFMSTTEGVWLSLLAPVAETMATTIAVYHLIKSQFPEISWIYIAIPSDLTFMLFHYFAYGMRADFLIVELILAIGNTAILWSYHITRNATVPMMAHMVINVVPNSQAIIGGLILWAPLVLLLFGVFLVVYIFLGGRRN